MSPKSDPDSPDGGASAPRSASSDPLGSASPYILEEQLGRGGMAEVYRARRDGPGGFVKDLALKRILPHFAGDERLVARFMDEARIAGALVHGNVVQVHDFGCFDGHHSIVMEYVEGLSLSAALEGCVERKFSLPAPVVAYIGAEVAEALAYAHGVTDAQGITLGLVHRDVSPQNVMLSLAGEVKLADFGIAKAVDKLARTEAGLLVGKLSYMSPEQARGGEVDGRSDLFALGIVLWEALTLETLLPRGRGAEALEALESCSFPSLGQRRADVDEELSAIVERALQKDPSRRFGDGAAMAKSLRTYLHRASPGFGAGDLARHVAWLSTGDGAPPTTGDGADGPQTSRDAPSRARKKGPLWSIVVPVLCFLLGAGLAAGGMHALHGLGSPPDDRASREQLPANRPDASHCPADREYPVFVTTDPPGAQIYVDGLLVGPSPTTDRREDDRAVSIIAVLPETIPIATAPVRPSEWSERPSILGLAPTDLDHGVVIVRSAVPEAILSISGEPIGPLPQTVMVRWEVDGSVNPQGLTVSVDGRTPAPADLSDARPWQVVHLTVNPM